MAIGLNKTLDGKWDVARESLRADLITIETFLNQIRIVRGAVVPASSSGILPVVNGGTGVATITNHGVVIGQGTSAVVAVVGTTNTVLHGHTGADPSFSAVVEADITLSNVTTNDVTIARHGFVPILPNDATKYLDGTGAWSTVTSGLSAPQVAARVSVRV